MGSTPTQPSGLLGGSDARVHEWSGLVTSAPATDGTELAALLAEVRRIDVQSKRLVTGVMAGGYTSVFRGSGIEFDEVREYEEGDECSTPCESPSPDHS